MLLVVVMLIIVVGKALYNRYKAMIIAILSVLVVVGVVGHLVREVVVVVVEERVGQVGVGRVHLLEHGGFDKGYMILCVWICVYMYIYTLLVGDSILFIT